MSLDWIRSCLDSLIKVIKFRYCRPWGAHQKFQDNVGLFQNSATTVYNSILHSHIFKDFLFFKIHIHLCQIFNILVNGTIYKQTRVYK